MARAEGRSDVAPKRGLAWAWPCVAALALGGCGGDRAAAPGVVAPGAPESAKTDVLELGAAVLQDDGPLAKLDIHLVGFHTMKEDPGHQMIAHHFCRQVNEDFAQCALFDGSGVEANLNGIEYIVSERLFETLPEEERASWHPHNAEILSGQLVAPGIPEVAETALMRSKMNSYGKTWHTWQSRHRDAPGDALPLGPARLAWSFNRDGELDPTLLAERDAALGIDTAEVRRGREDLLPLANPQDGVDDLRAAFPAATPIPGVAERAASEVSTAPSPAGSAPVRR